MKILVTGYSGQLGYDVVRYGAKLDHTVVGISTKDLDITDEESVSHYIKEMKPDAIIHCAAYTAVDKAEDDNESCWNVNVNGTKYLACAAKEQGAKFVYISTDYVFEGEGDVPYTESDEVNPVGFYGKTKLEGEKIVRNLIDNYFILRISWVFGINGNNFVKTMLRLAETRNELNIVDDQVGSPTYTYDLSRLIFDMIQSDKYGVYHVSNEGYCSWAEFAQEIFRQANIDVKVNKISTEEYPTRAVRPKNSRMSKQKVNECGFTPLQKWQEALNHFLSEFKQEVN